jgi:hypothetical protein
MLLMSTILKLGEKSATFQHRLKNLSTDSVAMTTDFKCVLLDLRRREAIPIPDDIRACSRRANCCVGPVAFLQQPKTIRKLHPTDATIAGTNYCGFCKTVGPDLPGIGGRGGEIGAALPWG